MGSDNKCRLFNPSNRNSDYFIFGGANVIIDMAGVQFRLLWRMGLYPMISIYA